MRATGAFLIVIAVLALGIGAMAFQSQAVEDPAVTNGTNTTADAYNLTEDVTETVTTPMTTLLVWGGFAALAFTAAGLILWAAAGGGGR